MRVVHQGVTYHKMAEPGARASTIEVYDVTEKLEGVTAVIDVQRFEATSDTLEVKQLITVRNYSRPPRTLSSDRGFEFRLPPQAQVQSGLVQVEEERRGGHLKNTKTEASAKLLPMHPSLKHALLDGDHKLSTTSRPTLYSLPKD